MLCKDSGDVLNTFSSFSEAKEYLNKKSSGPIHNAINGKAKSAYGYLWKKED